MAFQQSERAQRALSEVNELNVLSAKDLISCNHATTPARCPVWPDDDVLTGMQSRFMLQMTKSIPNQRMHACTHHAWRPVGPDDLMDGCWIRCNKFASIACLCCHVQVVRLDLDRSQQVVLLRLCGPGCIHILLRELAAAHINGRWGPRHEYVHTTDRSPN
jgi:hypothetical protein